MKTPYESGGTERLTWEQLREGFVCPDWFADARLGIWVHWGAQTQPELGGGWYARHMYMTDVGRETWGEDAYRYHCETYGHPSEKGFKDVAHEWKAEKLDTDDLLAYFKGLGAKYFIALANHHDHFDNFDSTHHPWNSVNVGPKRDIIGEFAASAKKHGVPFGVTSHDDRFQNWWLPAFGADPDGPKAGVPYDGHMTAADGKGEWWEGLNPQDLYGLPPEQRGDDWLDEIGDLYMRRHTELVEKYDIDMLWFDGHGFPYDTYGREVCTALYNRSLRQNGRISSVVVGKFHDREPSCIEDVERGAAPEMRPLPWQGTLTFGSWFYKGDRPIRHDGRTVIEMLCDMISKNGNLLLNVELLPDGTVPPEQKPIYDAIGAWVDLHSEAVHGSRPWAIYGDNLNSHLKSEKGSAIGEVDLEHAATQQATHFNERTVDSPMFGHDEVRFTTKGESLYVCVLNPAAGPIQLPSLGLDSPQKPGRVTAVRALGCDVLVPFAQDENALQLDVPASRPTPHAAVFEVRGAL
jgi:alpha-L-fucosidase